MRSALPVWLAVAFLVSASLVSAQEKGLELRMPGNLSISAPPSWRLANQTRDSTEIYVPLRKERKLPRGEADKNPKPAFVIASEAGMLITIEQRRDHAEAVRRLGEIASEYLEPATPLVIAGWPAIERRYRALMPQPGEEEVSHGNIETSFATTAIAVQSTVVRFNTMFAPDADPKLLDEALAIGRAFRAPEGPPDISKRELEDIQRMTKPPAPPPAVRPEPGSFPRPEPGGRNEPGIAVRVQTGLGELEVAASNDGQHVVVAANSGYSFSDNFGGTYTFGSGTPCNQTVCDGDPSLAVGNSGGIYYAWIGGTSRSTQSDGVSRSTDNGHTFTFRGLAATCPGTTSCTLADQEHIAADRTNAASGGGDRVYNVWRDFAPSFSIRISCSTDGGSTWTSGTAIGSGDFPRVSVGGDGFVYGAFASGGNMMLHKFSNCDAGLTPQVGWPVVVASFSGVVCPVPGLDRCNNGNILSSPKAAVDDLDPTHVYYAFATSTGAGNEDIMVYDSQDGGASFTRAVRVNSAVTARRYMPWISTYGGVAVVSWYDRRTATLANNDLTRYFIGGAAVRRPYLVALQESDLSGVDDTQCSTWPCAPRAITDSESCSMQPELAGRCFVSLGPPPVGSGAACDFSTPACSAGETCFAGSGCPKYGDYNGNAAAAGRMYSAWASATPPSGVQAPPGINIYANASPVPEAGPQLGSSRADYCRFVGIKPDTFLSCALARANNTFGNHDVNGKPGFPANFDPGYPDRPSFMVDVNNDGHADYCRFVGIKPDIFLSCAIAKLNNTFGNYDVNGKPGFPANFDPGYPDMPSFMVDVNNDGRADYCRFVGIKPNVFLSCALANKNNTFGNYDVNGKPGFPANFDPGYPDRPRFMVVNNDGRAEYCRFVGIKPDIFLSCALANKDNTFGNHDVNGTPGFPGNFDPGYPDRPRFMVGVRNDGRAAYCRFVGIKPDIFLSCAIAKLDNTFGNYDVNGKPGFPANFDPGYPNMPSFMVDVSGDGRADYCRFVGIKPNVYLSCALATLDPGSLTTTFGNYDVNGKPGFPANFDPGYSDMPSFMVDVNGPD